MAEDLKHIYLTLLFMQRDSPPYPELRQEQLTRTAREDFAEVGGTSRIKGLCRIVRLGAASSSHICCACTIRLSGLGPVMKVPEKFVEWIIEPAMMPDLLGRGKRLFASMRLLKMKLANGVCGESDQTSVHWPTKYMC